MGIDRGGKPQQLLQIDLGGGGGENVTAADHLGDAGLGIIDHHGQMIGKDAVCAAQDKIAGIFCKAGSEGALNPVLHSNRRVGDVQPVGRDLFLHLLPDFGRCQGAAGAGIHIEGIPAVWRLAGMELRPGTETGIDTAGIKETTEYGLVGGGALALGKNWPVPAEPEKIKV